jgi:hypothetical protein
MARQLGALTRHRHGNHFLPDNNEGRAMLVAFLSCRLKDDDAKQRAPWITDSDLENLKSEASGIELKQLGKLIGLTWDERIACRVYFLRASDITQEEANRRQAERNRENERKRQKEHRESMVKMRHYTSKRDDAVLRMLKMLPRIPLSAGLDPLSGWTPVSALVKEARRCDAFRRPDGRQQTNLRVPVHRVLKVLEANGQIEMTERPGPRGMVMLVRLVDLECPKDDERHTVSDVSSVVVTMAVTKVRKSTSAMPNVTCFVTVTA